MKLQSIINWKAVTRYKYLIALITAFNFLLTPVHIALSGLNPGFVIVINYTLVIISSSLLASTKLAKWTTYIIGILTLITIWLELSHGSSKPILIYRLLFSFLLFACFCVILIRQLLKIKEVNLKVTPAIVFIILVL